MKGIDFAEVRKAIESSFNPDDFDMFLFERLNFDRGARVPDGPFQKVVFDVLKHATAEGWDAILIAEAAEARPLRRDVQDLYKKYAEALIDEGRQHDIAESHLRAIEKFRLGPRIVVQTGGRPRTMAPVPAIDSALEKTVRPYIPTLDPGWFREKMFELEGQVCRVEAGKFGTGFLVGPDVLLTNYHVLKDAIDNRAAVAVPDVRFRFDYRVLKNGNKSEGTLVSLAPDWLLDYTPYTQGEAEGHPDAALPTEDQLDFALVRLDRALGSEPRSAGGAARGWINVPAVAPAIVEDMPIFILHHPKAAPIKLSIDTNAAARVNNNGSRIRYTTNTEGGSSGSPCFNVDWQLIALHHLGDPEHDKAEYNQGIPIHVIRERLRRQDCERFLGDASD